jgi:hypothetical protein
MAAALASIPKSPFFRTVGRGKANIASTRLIRCCEHRRHDKVDSMVIERVRDWQRGSLGDRVKA